MEELKGFIEVTDSKERKYTLNINYIILFEDYSITVKYAERLIFVKESYEEIKELIKKAQ